MTTRFRLFGARHSLAALTLVLSGLLAACSSNRVPPPEQARELLERYFTEAVDPVYRPHLHVEGFQPLRLDPLPGEPGKTRMDCAVILFADDDVKIPFRLLGSKVDGGLAEAFGVTKENVPQNHFLFMRGKMDFQPGGPTGWEGRVAETTMERTSNTVEEVAALQKRVADEIKNPDLKARGMDFTWQDKAFDKAPAKVIRDVAGVTRRVVDADYATRPAFQKVLYGLVATEAATVELNGAAPDPAALRPAFARLLAAEKPGTAYHNVLQKGLDNLESEIKRQEAAANAQTRGREEARRSPETVRAMVTTLARAAEAYAAKNQLPATAPVDWAALQKAGALTAASSAGETLPVTDKDPTGRPWVIGPRVGDGVRMAPETEAELSPKISGDEKMFWGQFSSNRFTGAQAALDGAKAVKAAITKCAAEKRLTAYDDVNWAIVEPFMEGGNVAFATGGKDPRGRPYAIGPTVHDGVFLDAASIQELRGSIPNNYYGDAAQGFFDKFHPVHRKVSPDGFRDAESDDLQYAMLRFEPGLLAEDKFIDEWASSHERETYQRDVNNEFVWNKRRQEIREKLRRGLERYPIKFRVHLGAQLEKYDATAGAFRVEGVQNLGSISLGNSMNAKLPSAMTLVGIPMEAGRAQALVERMLQANNSSRRVICEITMTLIGKVNDPRNYGRSYQANVHTLTFREKEGATPFCIFRL